MELEYSLGELAACIRNKNYLQITEQNTNGQQRKGASIHPIE